MGESIVKLYNLKNVINTHGGVLILVKLQAYKNWHSSMDVFHVFLNCTNDTKSRNAAHIRAFFLWATLFFISASLLLNFSKIELQMLLSCCLMHVSIIILRHHHTWTKNVINCQIIFSLRILLSFCLIFCQFQPGVA